MDIAIPTRVFKMGVVRLADPDPTMTPDAVRVLYSDTYSHLADCTVGSPSVDTENELTFEFIKPAGKTKGNSTCALPLLDALILCTRSEKPPQMALRLLAPSVPAETLKRALAQVPQSAARRTRRAPLILGSEGYILPYI